MHTLKHGNKEKLSIKIAFREKLNTNKIDYHRSALV